MSEFDKVLNLTKDQLIDLSLSFKNDLHKELCLGQTRFVCRYGTLSDGHDTGITDAQRYYSAKKQAWFISNEIIRIKAQAKIAQAELLEAEQELKLADTRIKELKAEAKVELAKQKITNCLVSVEDSLRQLDEYHQVIKELQESVRDKYPKGIEQAELDNWKSVAEYKSFQKQIGSKEVLTHLPLPAEEKAKIGVENNCPELTGWYLIQNKETIKNKYNGNWMKFLEEKFNVNLGVTDGKNVLGHIR